MSKPIIDEATTIEYALLFDTETNGKVSDFNADPKDRYDLFPRMLQFSAILASYDTENQKAGLHNLMSVDVYINWFKEEGFVWNEEAQAHHGITPETIQKYGLTPYLGMGVAGYLFQNAKFGIAHNAGFDYPVVISNFTRLGLSTVYQERMDYLCTMKAFTDLLQLPNRSGYSGYKWPNLDELHQYFVGTLPDTNLRHSASYDTQVLFDAVSEGMKKEIIRL